MGRPSKLSARTWDDIGVRLLHDEKAADLAREFKVSDAAISVRFSEGHRVIRQVAHELVRADEALRALPQSEQLAALRLAEKLLIETNAERLASIMVMKRMFVVAKLS